MEAIRLSIEEKREELVTHCMRMSMKCDDKANNANTIRLYNIYRSLDNSWRKRAAYLTKEANISYINKLYNDTFTE